MNREKSPISQFSCVAVAVTVLLLSGISPVAAQTATAPAELIPKVKLPTVEIPDVKLPSVEMLLEKMVNAVGGEKAIRMHTSQSVTVVFEVPAQGIIGDFTSRSAKGNLSTTQVSMPGFGDFLQGSNGAVIWSDNPQEGAQILEGAKKEQRLIQSIFYPLLDIKKTYKDIKVAGVTKHAGQKCYELNLTTQSGGERRMYVNMTSFLIAGEKFTASMPMGDVEFISEFSDYKEFDGVMIATNNLTDIGGFMQQILTIEEVSFEPLEKGTFDLPDSIKKLLADDDEPATSQPSD